LLVLNAEKNGVNPNLLGETLYYIEENMLLLLFATASLGMLTSFFSIYVLEKPVSEDDRSKSFLAVFPMISILLLLLQIGPYSEISRSGALVNYDPQWAVMSISIAKTFAIGQIALWAFFLGMFVFSYAKVLRRVESISS
jgi:membrane-associated HD superfamily phosphohydrolase